MILLITTNQMNTSKNPNKGAMYFFPRETKIILNVPNDTSKILEQNINIGKMTQVNISLFIKLSILTLSNYKAFKYNYNLLKYKINLYYRKYWIE